MNERVRGHEKRTENSFSCFSPAVRARCTFSRTGDGPDTDLSERSARGEGIPPVSDASFTKETHTRSLTQLPILGNMRQWTGASRANGEVLGATDVREEKRHVSGRV